MDAKQKKLLREHRERRESAKESLHQHNDAKPSSASQYSKFHAFMDKHYKHLLIVTMLITLISLGVIAHTYITSGDVFYKGVSLSGGVTLTINTQDTPVDVNQIEELLKQSNPKNDIIVTEISDFGTQRGLSIEASPETGGKQSLSELSTALISSLRTKIPDIDKRVSVEETGPSLGESFFQQTLKAILIAFVCMGLVVFLYFGETLSEKIIVFTLSIIEAMLIWYASSIAIIALAVLVGAVLFVMYIKYSIPSTAVVLAAASTMIFTIAVVDIMGMRISTAGIAAFLMLVGYSVDTDILLSTRVLKSNVGTIYDRTMSTFATGITMTGTTFCAALVSYLFTQSEVIKEIMLIICIGLIADIYNTWIQNAGILRWHLESKGRK